MKRRVVPKRSGVDIDAFPDDESLVRKVASLGIDVGIRESRGRLIDKLVSTFVEPNLIQPTFSAGLPGGYVAPGQGKARLSRVRGEI